MHAHRISRRIFVATLALALAGGLAQGTPGHPPAASAQMPPTVIVAITPDGATVPLLYLVVDTEEHIYQRRNTTVDDLIGASGFRMEVVCRDLLSAACDPVLDAIGNDFADTGERAPGPVVAGDWSAPAHPFGSLTVFASDDPDGGPTARVAFQSTGTTGATDLERMVWFVDTAQAVTYFQTVDTADFAPDGAYGHTNAYYIASTP
ncbi:MAG: hypothetical protein AAGH15_01685 [Myxococcota bacterium]